VECAIRAPWRYFARSKESGDEVLFFAFSTVVDEDAMVDGVGDFLEESGRGTATPGAWGRPYLLCRVDSAAA